MEDALKILERRGYSIVKLVERLKDGKLPTFRVVLGNQEHWFYTREEVDAYRRSREIKKGAGDIRHRRRHACRRCRTATRTADVFSSQEAARRPGRQSQPGEAEAVRHRHGPRT